MTSLDSLPEEILVHLISYLDVKPPSVLRLRKEPTSHTFESHEKSLKSLSCSSKSLRRVVLPVLFKYARLNVAPFAQCCVTHLILPDTTTTERDERTPQLTSLDHPPIDKLDCSDKCDWDTGIDRYEEPFEAFLKTHDLVHHVASLLVYVNDFTQMPMYRHFGSSLDRFFVDKCAAFWHRVFNIVDLPRVVMLAPPAVLARLISCQAQGSSLNLFMPDMHYQVIELIQAPSSTTPMSKAPGAAYGFATSSSGSYRLTTSSLLHMRRYSHVALNEGSFLHSYGRLDWFEMGMPFDLTSLLRFLFPSCCSQNTTAHTHRYGHIASGLSHLESFDYTAIYPFDHHLQLDSGSGVHQLHYLHKISLRLTPDPEESVLILNDPARVGCANISECWEHVQLNYLKLRQLLFWSRNKDDWMLRTVVCEDHANEVLRKDLQDSFAEYLYGSARPDNEDWLAWGRTWRMVESRDGTTLAVGA